MAEKLTIIVSVIAVGMMIYNMFFRKEDIGDDKNKNKNKM